MEINPEMLGELIRKTPLPLIADDVITEGLRLRNMGFFDSEPQDQFQGPSQDQYQEGLHMNKTAFELGYKKAADISSRPPLFGPQSSVWERMMIGQLIGSVPGAVAAHYMYPKDYESQAAVTGTASSLGALGGILAPNIREWLGVDRKPRPIGLMRDLEEVIPKKIPIGLMR
jgi:hypothetical protein